MSVSEADGKALILKRLRRVEGQIVGIQKMIEEEKGCVDILTQVSAVRSAVNKVGGLILERYTSVCLSGASTAQEKETAIKELTKTVQSFLKFVS